MPIDAVDRAMRVWVLVDAAKDLIVIWAAVGFKRRNGEWSVAFLIGRCLLVPNNMSIPRGSSGWVQPHVDVETDPLQVGRYIHPGRRHQDCATLGQV